MKPIICLMTLVLTGLAPASVFAAPPVRAVDYRIMGEDERAISMIEGALKTDSDGHKETVFYIGFSQPVGGPGGARVVSATILFDCATNRYKVGTSSSFAADMTPIQKGTVQYGWRDVVPESPFSRAWAYACQGAALPRATGVDVKAIMAGYLDRRAAATPEPAAAP